MNNSMRRSMWALWLLVALLALGPALTALAGPPAQPPNPLTALEAASSEPVSVSYNAGTGAADYVSGAFATSGATPDARARGFLSQHGQLFGIRDPQAELSVMRTASDDLGMSHVVYEQQYREVPVFGARLVVHMDRAGQVTAVNGQFQPAITLDDLKPAISGAEAQGLVQARLRSAAVEWQQAPRLVIWTHNRGGTAARLAWEVLGFTGAPLGRWRSFIDAHTGEVVYQLNELDTARNRTTYTANNGTGLPGTLLCNEGNPSGCNSDAVAKAAHDNAGVVYDYYKNTFNRDSYDAGGAELRSTVHYDNDYNNAFWNGSQMVYGDGDGTVFSPLAEDLDVVAHELTHAVTQETSGLFYEGQSGALNESYSDVFAVFVNPGNWQIGENAYTPGIPGDALRDLQDPTMGGQWDPNDPSGSDGQPDRMGVIAVLPTVYDQGGVHINSGIPNKAAYLIAAGGTFQGISVTGIGQTKSQQIYYRTQALYNTPFTDFANAANNTYRACRDLAQAGSFGITTNDCNSVLNSWAAVGVGPRASQTHHVFVPILKRIYPNTTPGIFGQVTVGGAPAAGQELALYRCPDSGNCTLIGTTAVDGNGHYRFNAPPLPANNVYVVYYAQDSSCGLWGAWRGNSVTQFAAGQSKSGGDFDLAAIQLVSPKGNVSGASQTFRWNTRTLPSGMLQDLPSVQIYDGSGSTLLYQSSPKARGTTMATVSGFSGGSSYIWAVQTYAPGGLGIPACGATINVSAAASGSPTSEAALVPLRQSTGGERYPETLDLRAP